MQQEKHAMAWKKENNNMKAVTCISTGTLLFGKLLGSMQFCKPPECQQLKLTDDDRSLWWNLQ